MKKKITGIFLALLFISSILIIIPVSASPQPDLGDTIYKIFQSLRDMVKPASITQSPNTTVVDLSTAKITASSVYVPGGYTPSTFDAINAIDGDTLVGSSGTYWQPNGGGIQWWQADFGAGKQVNVSRISLYLYYSDIPDLTVEYSDGSIFTVVKSVSKSPEWVGGLASVDIDLPPTGAHRIWRISTSDARAWRILDLVMFSPTTPTTPSPTSSPTSTITPTPLTPISTSTPIPVPTQTLCLKGNCGVTIPTMPGFQALIAIAALFLSWRWRKNTG